MAASDTASAAASAGPRWGRVLAVAIVLAVFFELFCQLFVYLWAGEPYRSLSFYRWSPYGLVRNNPDLTSPSFRISPNGFRNLRTFTREKPEGVLRIMMFGGSVLYSGLGGPAVLLGEGRQGSGETMAQYLQKSLENDPALEGVEIEVINAGVNWNRIVEVSTAYLAEWVYWDPDLVIVCGSGNNVHGRVPDRGSIYAGNYGTLRDHPWASEFERTVNERSLRAMVERAQEVAASRFASAGVMRKVLTKAMDAGSSWIHARRFRVPEKAPREPADAAEIEHYFRAFAAQAAAMVATARWHDQDIAFFWEYFLGNLEGIKPFSEDEAFLFESVELAPSGRDYNFGMRDRLESALGQMGVPLVDPLEELRSHDETVFIDYLHYTPGGNEFMARVIHEQLAEMIHSRAQKIRAARSRP